MYLSLIRTGYIDLSKRRVSPEDIVKCEERYMKSKTVASIMRHVASKLVGGEPDPSAPQPESGETSDATKKSQKSRGDVEEHDDGGAGEQNEESRLEHLYEQIAWPLGKKYGHPYDAFKIALTCVVVCFGGNSRSCSSDGLISGYLQRTRHRPLVAGDACTGGHPDTLDVHHRATAHAPADQAAG
jgi:hypothetical protein